MRILDAHNDLLMELAFRRAEDRPFERYWLDQLVAGRVKVQVCPVFTAHEPAGERLRAALSQIAAFHRAVADRPDAVHWIRSREDLDEVLAGDRIGMVLALEGAEPFEDDPELVDAFWDLGVRMASFTWNASNRFATGGAVQPDEGLTDDGRALARRLQERGYVLDLTHTSPQTFTDLVALSDGVPPVLTHTGCRAVYDTPRNATDEQLRELAAVGGVVGIMLLPLTVDLDAPTLDRVVDHIEHAAAIAGEEHVGIGSDFVDQLVRSGAGGLNPAAAIPAEQRGTSADPGASLAGLEGPAGFPALVAALRRRGWDGDRLDALLLGNFARVLRQGLPARRGV